MLEPPKPEPLAGTRRGCLTGPAVATAILLLFWLAMVAGLRDKSLTYDEAMYAVAGASYWRLGDYRLSPEAGLLPQRVAGLPLALGPYQFPSADSDDWHHSQLTMLAYNWFYRMGNDAQRMAAAGRAACGGLAVLLGAVVWAWARRLFGPRGGMISLLLYVLSPTILANGALMTSDMAAALFFLAATWGWWAVLHRLSPGRLLASGLLAGGLLVSKMSGVLIIPVMLALAAARCCDGRPLPVACGRWRGEIHSRTRLALAGAVAGLMHVVIVAAVIWAFSGFRFAAMPHPTANDHFLHSWEYALNLPERGVAPAAGGSPPSLGVAAATVAFMRRHELLPEGWLFGFAAVLRRAESRPAFWNGVCSETGWPGYFPYTFLVKTPLAVFGVCGLALGAGWRSWRARAGSQPGRRARAAWRQMYDTLPLWVLSAVYWLAAISSHLNIGHRHLLPVYAPMFVLCGASAGWLRRGKDHKFAPASGSSAGVPPAISPTAGGDACATIRWPGVALCALLALLAVETAWRFPNYLAYFNGIIRPAEAYRHLVDSSLDWGQELPAARQYIDRHPQEGPYYLSYFGTASPAYFGVAARRLYSFGVPSMADDPDLLLTRLPPGDIGGAMARLQRAQTAYDLMGVLPLGTDDYAVSLRRATELRLAAGTYLISATMLQPVYYSGPWGPWSPRYEAVYRRLERSLRPLLELDSSTRAEAFRHYDLDTLAPLLEQFQQYRLARLTAYLRGREPDTTLNDSILVYHLTDAELARALD